MDITLHGFARFSMPLVVLKELWCCCGVVVVLLSCRCHVVVLSLRGDEGCHLRATVMQSLVCQQTQRELDALWDGKPMKAVPQHVLDMILLLGADD